MVWHFLCHWKASFNVTHASVFPQQICVLWPLWCPSGTCCSSPLTWWGLCGRSPAPAPPRRPWRRARTSAPSSEPARSSASPAGPAAPPPGSPHGLTRESRWTVAEERRGQGGKGDPRDKERFKKKLYICTQLACRLDWFLISFICETNLVLSLKKRESIPFLFRPSEK